MISASSDPRDALELVEALEMLERRRRTDNLKLRPFSAELLAVARADSARGRQGTTTFDGSRVDPDCDAVPLPRLLDKTEVADRLDVGMRTVERMISSGELPVVRIGAAVRVHSDDLVEFMDALRSGHTSTATDAVSERKVFSA